MNPDPSLARLENATGMLADDASEELRALRMDLFREAMAEWLGSPDPDPDGWDW
jgi:hypothetical protein